MGRSSGSVSPSASTHFGKPSAIPSGRNSGLANVPRNISILSTAAQSSAPPAGERRPRGTAAASRGRGATRAAVRRAAAPCGATPVKAATVCSERTAQQATEPAIAPQRRDAAAMVSRHPVMEIVPNKALSLSLSLVPKPSPLLAAALCVCALWPPSRVVLSTAQCGTAAHGPVC